MRISAFILAFYYLLSIGGFGLKFHYCMGDVTGVNYALFDASCHCDDAHQGRIHGCCEEKSVFVQVDNQHHGAVQGLESFKSLPLLTEWSWDWQQRNELCSEHSGTPFERGPPRTVESYRMFCSFIFYG